VRSRVSRNLGDGGGGISDTRIRRSVIPLGMAEAPAASAPDRIAAAVNFVIEGETPKAAPPKIRGRRARWGGERGEGIRMGGTAAA